MKHLRYTILSLALTVAAAASAQHTTTKRERNYIKEGNTLYEKQRYAEAEVAYRKALEENNASEVAAYNLASSLIKQAGNADPNNGNSPVAEATQLLTDLAKSAKSASIAEKSFYNLGNLAFNNEKFQESIDMYKNALRRNPDNDNARENLRLAQLKLQQQQQNQDNKDQKDDKQDKDNQDNNKDQKEKNKDQQQDNNQDKDQNKDKNKEDQQKQNQDQNQGNQDKQDKPEQNRQPQGISDANAEKILKAMENEENATRRRVNAKKQESDAKASKRNILKPW